MPFNPNEHLIKLQGKDYLEVRWRLSWLREQHPDASIVTEIVAMDVAAEWAIIRATVTLPDGGGSATGMALQRPTAIAKDFIANGETSAIGRALGALGFGTQHAVEFDQGEQVVDAPVERKSSAAAGAPIPPLPPANLAKAEPAQESDPELVTKRAALTQAMQDFNWTPKRLLDAAGTVWPHILTKADMQTLTAFQVGRLTDVVTGESIIDSGGRIVPAPEQPTIVAGLAEAMR
jgi:hypothetical protein